MSETEDVLKDALNVSTFGVSGWLNDTRNVYGASWQAQSVLGIEDDSSQYLLPIRIALRNTNTPLSSILVKYFGTEYIPNNLDYTSKLIKDGNLEGGSTSITYYQYSKDSTVKRQISSDNIIMSSQQVSIDPFLWIRYLIKAVDNYAYFSNPNIIFDTGGYQTNDNSGYYLITPNHSLLKLEGTGDVLFSEGITRVRFKEYIPRLFVTDTVTTITRNEDDYSVYNKDVVTKYYYLYPFGKVDSYGNTITKEDIVTYTDGTITVSKENYIIGTTSEVTQEKQYVYTGIVEKVYNYVYDPEAGNSVFIYWEESVGHVGEYDYALVYLLTDLRVPDFTDINKDIIAAQNTYPIIPLRTNYESFIAREPVEPFTDGHIELFTRPIYNRVVQGIADEYDLISYVSHMVDYVTSPDEAIKNIFRKHKELKSDQYIAYVEEHLGGFKQNTTGDNIDKTLEQLGLDYETLVGNYEDSIGSNLSKLRNISLSFEVPIYLFKEYVSEYLYAFFKLMEPYCVISKEGYLAKPRHYGVPNTTDEYVSYDYNEDNRSKYYNSYRFGSPLLGDSGLFSKELRYSYIHIDNSIVVPTTALEHSKALSAHWIGPTNVIEISSEVDYTEKYIGIRFGNILGEWRDTLDYGVTLYVAKRESITSPWNVLEIRNINVYNFILRKGSSNKGVYRPIYLKNTPLDDLDELTKHSLRVPLIPQLLSEVTLIRRDKLCEKSLTSTFNFSWSEEVHNYEYYAKEIGFGLQIIALAYTVLTLGSDGGTALAIAAKFAANILIMKTLNYVITKIAELTDNDTLRFVASAAAVAIAIHAVGVVNGTSFSEMLLADKALLLANQAVQVFSTITQTDLKNVLEEIETTNREHEQADKELEEKIDALNLPTDILARDVFIYTKVLNNKSNWIIPNPSTRINSNPGAYVVSNFTAIALNTDPRLPGLSFS